MIKQNYLTMTRIFTTLLLLFTTLIINAQTTYNSGDPDLDKELTEANKEAKLDLTKFKNDLLSVFKIPVEKAEALLKDKMEPAEILLTAKISSISKKPLEQVVICYKTNKTKGWGYIAKEMGIKPGSPEFHALKNKGKKNTEKENHGKGNGKSK